jgi:ribosomal protein S15P/S13E
MLQTQEEKMTSYNISAKVSAKGAVSLYGLQRFPVTLYADQLEAILDKAESLRKFMKEHKKYLASKSDATTVVGTVPL